MKKIIFLVTVILCFVCNVYATPFTVEFDITINNSYDYEYNYDMSLPIQTFLSVSFDNTVTRSQNDDGFYILIFDSVTFNSPFTSMINENPYGLSPNNKGSFYFSVVKALQEVHISFRSEIDDMNPNDEYIYWYYILNLSLNFDLIEPLIVDDFNYTVNNVIDILKYGSETHQRVHFTELFNHCDFSLFYPIIYMDGYYWGGYGEISNITETPESKTFILFGIGILSLSFIHRKKHFFV